MAQARFFKKSSPNNVVVLGNEHRVQFSTLDNQWGYFATNDQYIQDEFLRLMRESRYGLTEISYADYDTEYLVKKKAGIQRSQPSREELTPSSLRRQFQSVPESSAVVPPVVDKTNMPSLRSEATVADVTPTTPTPAPVNPEFTPRTGKRKPKAATP